MAFRQVSHFYLSACKAQDTHCSESLRFPYFEPQELEDHECCIVVQCDYVISVALFRMGSNSYRSE